MPSDTLHVTLVRYDPATDVTPRHVQYRVPRQDGMVIADVLQHLYEHEVPDLAFLWECRTRRCGTCAVRLGDRPVLGCAEPVQDNMVLAPLDGFPVLRDLIVDRFDLRSRVAPWTNESGRFVPKDVRVLQAPAEIAHYRALSECIDCFICDSVCPALKENVHGGSQFAGPRQLIRTEAQVQRRGEALPWLIDAARGNPSLCTRCFACTESCPRDLRPAEAIGALTNRLYNRGELDAHKAAHIGSFVRSVRTGGWLDEFRLLVDVYGLVKVLKLIPQGWRMLWRGKLPKPHLTQRPQGKEIEALIRNLQTRQPPEPQFAYTPEHSKPQMPNRPLDRSKS